ncbi:MAG: hypothetical protein ACRDDH_14495 [Cetobacterium sp.]|uniref:hypothetical protein n=1 Tax=Cetobacterium sp. TaxID=2071632 RepID=UPI003EE7BD73
MINNINIAINTTVNINGADITRVSRTKYEACGRLWTKKELLDNINYAYRIDSVQIVELGEPEMRLTEVLDLEEELHGEVQVIDGEAVFVNYKDMNVVSPPEEEEEEYEGQVFEVSLSDYFRPMHITDRDILNKFIELGIFADLYGHSVRLMFERAKMLKEQDKKLFHNMFKLV